jgi:hypothetical protein
MHSCSHLADFFRTDDALVERVVAFMREGFASGCTCIAALMPQHRVRVAKGLAACGLDEATLIATYRYIVLDARKMLDSVRSAGVFDVAKVHKTFGQLLSLAASGGRDVRVVGEIVTLLAQEGDGRGVIQLEEIWNDLSRQYPFTLFCPYPTDVFESSLTQRHLAQVRALHSRSPAHA